MVATYSGIDRLKIICDTIHVTLSYTNMSQLTLDFNPPSGSVRTGEVRAQSSVQYHADASMIESSRFALKMSLRNRSFLIR